MTRQSSAPADWHGVVHRRLHDALDSLTTLKDTPFEQETLHDARVSCRRAECGLQICRDLLPTRHATWLRTHLRQLRRAGNSARDHDVLEAWLEDQDSPKARQLRDSLRHKRQADHERVAKLAVSLIRDGRFAHHVEHVCQPASDPSDSELWQRCVARRLLDRLFHLVRALPMDATNLRQWHRLRIASKELRYAYECVSEALPTTVDAPLETMLKQIQERLGAVNDVFVRQQQFRELVKLKVSTQGLPDPSDELARISTAWYRWWASISLEAVIGTAVTTLLPLVLWTGPSGPDQNDRSSQ